MFITCTIFSCQKKEVIDAIPKHCEDASFANFTVNNELQIISDNTIDGVNLNYLFGAKPNGEWSLSLESEQFLFSLNHAQMISFDQYLILSREEYLEWMKANANIDILESNLVSNLLFQDLTNNELYLKEDLTLGQAKMQYTELNNCAYIEVEYQLEFKKDTLENVINGILKSAVVPKS